LNLPCALVALARDLVPRVFTSFSEFFRFAVVTAPRRPISESDPSSGTRGRITLEARGEMCTYAWGGGRDLRIVTVGLSPACSQKLETLTALSKKSWENASRCAVARALCANALRLAHDCGLTI